MVMNLRCLKWAIPAGIVLWALILWPVFAANLDVCLKITGTKAAARDALTILGLDKEMLHRDEAGNLTISTANHHVAIDLWMKPILVFGTHDNEGNEITPPVFAPNPIMRIRFISDEARAKAKTKIIDNPELPAGLAKVPCPTTRIWAGD